MTDDERIDLVLTEMAKKGDGRLDIKQYLLEEIHDDDYLSFQRVIANFRTNGYAQSISGGLGTIYEILQTGKDIVNSGGYIKYLERLKAMAEAEEHSRNIKTELDEVNLKLNGFYFKYKWLPFMLSGFAILISIAAIIISIVKSKPDL